MAVLRPRVVPSARAAVCACALLLAIGSVGSAETVSPESLDAPSEDVVGIVLSRVGTVKGEVETVLEEEPVPSLHCHPDENPHRYAAAAPAPGSVSDAAEGPVGAVERTLDENEIEHPPRTQVQEEPPLAGLVHLHDGSLDCHGQGMDVIGDESPDVPSPTQSVRSDGDFEYGIGGGFFPADHHGAAFAIFDEAGGDVGFMVASDENGDGLLNVGECRELFIQNGATTCAPGADGGWWVITHPRLEIGSTVSDPPTAGIIVSGPISRSSQVVGIAALASATIHWDGIAKQFTWSSPGGWDCYVGTNDPTSATAWFGLGCYAPAPFTWDCQGFAVFLVATHMGTGAPAHADGYAECHPTQAGWSVVWCRADVDATNPVQHCSAVNPLRTMSPIYCSLVVTDAARVKSADLECFNDP